MIVPDAQQRSALEASLAGLVILTGPPGSGKSTTLLRRAAAAIAAQPEIPLAGYVVTSTAPGAGPLRARLRAQIDPARHAELDAVPWLGGELATVAHAILAENALAARLALDLTLIDDDEAEAAFERAGAALFALEWTEFVTAEIDPELAGMRAPERFAAAALRLFRKLRAALIGPQEFLSCALRGAISFYATPPNFANPDLLQGTREEYRDSLDVDRAELERQRLREVDLAKVLARLYGSYLGELVAAGCLTATDAIAEATRLLRERPDLARRYRGEFVAAFVDDAQDLTAGALGFLTALFGEELAGVTFAGDRDQTTQTFAGARPERVFALRGTTIVLEGTYRVPPAIAAAARAILTRRPELPDRPGIVRLLRARSPAEEARLIAGEIRGELVAGGADPGAIALVVRSFVWMRPYRDALVGEGIPVALVGPLDLYDEPDVADALALLWATCDPFRHDWLLRALGTATVRLNDLGLYALCGEPSDPQTALFELPDDGDSVRGRWDRRRNLRLALNVVRGDRDADLEPQTRARVVALRARLERWRALAAELAPEDAAALIVAEGGLREPAAGETGARSALRDDLLEALLRRIAAYAGGTRRRTLEDFLSFAERTSLGDRPRFERIGRDGVAVASIEALKGAEFAHVFVCNVRAGAFPAYYAPDAFLFSPTYGVIPKDNVGDAATTRTAKFTWYLHHAKLKDRYAREDRHALYCALTRARESVTLSAGGRPTRGIGAPELLVELHQARLPYVRDVGAQRGATGPRLELVRPPRPAAPSAAQPAASSLTVGIDDLAGARRCGRCARRAFLLRRAVPGPSAPVPKPPAGATIVAADVPFALRFARGLVADRVPWVLDLKGTRIACVPAADAADLWLLAAAELGVRDDAVVVASGSLSPRRTQAPPSEEVEAWLDGLGGVAGPLCAECAEALG